MRSLLALYLFHKNTPKQNILRVHTFQAKGSISAFKLLALLLQNKQNKDI